MSGVIQGTVRSAETESPLPSVSVAVRSAADSSIVGGELTGPEGEFRVTSLRPGRYLVQVSLVGYETYERGDLEITSAVPVVDLGTIRLDVSAVALEGVEVEAERSNVVVAPDRTIYNTAEMPVASGGTATDLLRGVPELEVDIEGNVSLRGTGAQIYINGRPAPMEGDALNLFLQQFPADRIERIEVISNPSARFEAEGGPSGIINIVLKEDAELGLSGSVFANGGTRGELGGGARLAYQRGALTLFGGGFLRHMDRHGTSYDLRQNLITDPVTFLEQDEWSERNGLSGSMDFSAELKTGEQSTLWSELQFYRNGFDSEGVTEYTEMDADRSPTERYDRIQTSESQRLSTEIAAGWDYVIQPRRHELSAEIEYEVGSDEDESLVRQETFAVGGGSAALPVELTTDDESGNETDLSFELDYTRPWGEAGQIEVGYRGGVEDSDQDRLLQIFPDAAVQEPGVSTESGFAFGETSHAAYLILTHELGAFGVQAGVRAERSDTRLELPTGDVFDNTYQSLFPSASVTYDFDRGRQVRFSYSRRVRRPSPWVLNPINRSTDPLNRFVGNPDIEPQYVNSLVLETSWSGQKGTLRFSPYYRRTEGDWARIQTVDTDGVSTTTWENLASIESYGTSITASLRPVGPISGHASVSGYREVRNASNLSLDYSGTAMRWSARGNVMARLTPSLDFQGMLYYTPAHDVAQGRVSSMIMTHVGLRQQFLDDRAAINLMVTDPFDMFDYSFETRDPTHIQIGSSRRSFRQAMLSVSYSFGRPPEDGRDREGPREPEPEMQEPGEPPIP